MDEHKRRKWPKHFAFPPRSGDWVKAQDGTVLDVVKVTHCFGEGPFLERLGEIPYIEVELFDVAGAKVKAAFNK